MTLYNLAKDRKPIDPFERLQLPSFDSIFESYGSKNYPPVSQYVSEDGSRSKIELAIAGYAKSDISVRVEGNKLIIEAEKHEKKIDEAIEWVEVSRGIALRSFSREWLIKDGHELDSAKMEDGILTVFFKKRDGYKKSIEIL